jgi:hypothetical protein
MERVIYTPDGEPVQFEWYYDADGGLGVSGYRQSWVPRPVGPLRVTGFGAGRPDPKPVRKPKRPR